MTTQILRYDEGEIKSFSEFTDEGFLKCEAIVTRTGVFFYRNADGSIRRELRLPDEVFHLDSLATMKMIPVTNDHPSERIVNAENSKNLSVGYTGESIYFEDNFVFANFVITDKDTIDDIVNKNKKQLSLGYTVELLEQGGVYQDEEFDFIQKNIQYNHLSIVQTARAGAEATIVLDEADAIEIPKIERDQMTKRKVKIDEDEFLLEPEAAESVESLLEMAKVLEADKTRMEEELSTIKEKLEKALAERDNAKEEATALLSENESLKEENTDSKEIDRKVKERIKLLKVCESVLNADEIEATQSLNEIEIKKKIIKAKSPSAKLDEKSDVYINARYDAVVEDIENKVVMTNVKKSKQDKSLGTADESRNKMIENQMNGYLREGK